MRGTPVHDALDGAATAIAAAGSPTARLDAEVLLAHVLGVERTRLHVEDIEVEGAAVRRFQDLVRRRSVGHEPVAYLVGRRGFRRLELGVDPRVLIPRPETEHVVEAVVELAPPGRRVVDVGTGSGAIALALADERPDLEVCGSDVSAEALEVARANGARLGLVVVLGAGRPRPGGRSGTWWSSNPPYVATGDALPADVRDHEPAQALFAGDDGLAVLRRLAEVRAPLLVVEVGAGQAAAVRSLLRAAGFQGTERAQGPRRGRARGGGVALSDDFDRCMRSGGVAVFPADTVYGLACDAQDARAIARLYALKGRPPGKPAAIMVFAAVDLPPLGPRTAAAAAALLPGPVTLLVRSDRYPLAGGGGGVLGLRFPDVPLLAGARGVVLQSSANRAGGPDPRRLDDVPAEIRAGADLLVDGGELPGTPSTVIDLTRYDDGGAWSIVRAGALTEAAVADALKPPDVEWTPRRG